MNLPVAVGFKVVAESADWIVVDKPAPLIVHPANNQDEPTLLGGLEKLLAFEIANGATLGIVTRLDRETSGLVLVAKHTAAARELGMMFERREPGKEYLAIVHGWPEMDEWTCAAPILRAGEIEPSRIWVRQMVHPDGKPCLTSFRVEKRFERNRGNYSLVRCFPETGRMHQIRVHLAHVGFSIAGDKIYSGNGSAYLQWMEHGWTDQLAGLLPLRRHALHAAKLTLSWGGRAVSWASPLPADLVDFINGGDVGGSSEVVIWNRRS
ncbi:MAG: RNA pseudouridine synthase [Verrucomicrobiota bacterium]